MISSLCSRKVCYMNSRNSFSFIFMLIISSYILCICFFLKNALLQETSEEWEQCEKKMKDVRSWIDKSHQGLESPQNKKRPLRDQLSLREKMKSDIAIRKKTIRISVDKLQVHCSHVVVYLRFIGKFTIPVCNTVIVSELCIGSHMENIKRNVKTKGKFKMCHI